MPTPLKLSVTTTDTDKVASHLASHILETEFPTERTLLGMYGWLKTYWPTVEDDLGRKMHALLVCSLLDIVRDLDTLDEGLEDRGTSVEEIVLKLALERRNRK